MSGIWLAVMAVGLVAVGVAAQLGWELPEIPMLKRVFARRRADVDAPTAPLGEARGPVVRPGL